MADTKKVLMAAVGVGGISLGLSYLYKTLIANFPAFANGIATISFSAVDINVKSRIQSGIDTSLGGKVVQYLQGYIPIGEQTTAILTLLVASLAVVWLGGIIAGKLTIGKSENVRFAVGMTLAAAGIGALLGAVSPSFGWLGALVAMGVYFGIVATIYAWLRTIDGIKDLFPSL